MREDIRNLSFAELEKWLLSVRQPKYRAQQIFVWLYQKRVAKFEDMKNLPAGLLDSIRNSFGLYIPEIAQKQKSKIDGTIKYLFKLLDNEYIETVVIPAGDRITICLSTQVGCRYKCKFCASGILGFRRNLSQTEILSQIITAQNEGYKITNIVFMGTGEPLDNLDNVRNVIKIINDKNGFNIGARRITISTSGIPDKIRELADLGLQIELSISLHAADDKKRDILMPINKLYPLGALLNAVKEYYERTNRLITFEYVLIRGVNDSQEDAENLVKLLHGMKYKVNLIPFSPVQDIPYQSPNSKSVDDFKEILEKADVGVTVRASKGADISAACGQLRIKQVTKN